MKQCPKCSRPVSGQFCTACGTRVPLELPSDSGKGSTGKTVVIVILACVVAILTVLVFYLQGQVEDAEWELSRMTRDRNDYRSKYNDILEEYEFYHEFARVRMKEDDDVYHKYDCELRTTTGSFWIYNWNNAMNYATPCPECCPDDAE